MIGPGRCSDDGSEHTRSRRHTGIAVRDIEQAEPVLSALGCRKLVEESVEGRFRWAQYDFGRDASGLELIAPEAEDTFLTAYLDEHGPGLHHVTLEVADIDAVAAPAGARRPRSRASGA